MNWINIHTTFLRSPEFMSANSTQQSAWLKLLGYCSEQENGGTIKGAKQWQPMQWCYACCVTFEEVSTPSPLWKWRGDDFILHAYPKSKEDEVRAKRESGKRGGKHSGEARREAQLRSTPSPESEAQLRTERKGKGMEGEGEGKGEGEKKENSNQKEEPTASLSAFDEFWSLYPRKDGKHIARKAWQKARPDLEKVKASLAWQKDSEVWTKDNGQFIPMPATYLNQRRYEDDAPVHVHMMEPTVTEPPPEEDLWEKLLRNKAKREAEELAEAGEPEPEPFDGEGEF